MNYDSVSFLTGLAVGRSLKGWGTVGRENRCPRAEPESVCDFYEAVASGALSWTSSAQEQTA